MCDSIALSKQTTYTIKYRRITMKAVICMNDGEFRFNVKILVNGVYAGCGRFCRTMDEVKSFVSRHGALDNTFVDLMGDGNIYPVMW